MNIPFKRVTSLFAISALAGLLAFTAQADELKEIRIAVPDLSAGTQHSGGGVVDVLRDRQIFERLSPIRASRFSGAFSKAPGR
jgi:sulfonate transport system substrate-binding protein